MRKYLVFLICLILVFIGMSSAIAEISIPTVYCDGKEVSTREIVEYDIAEGSLVIKWDKQTDAKKYYYKCIGLNEVPDFDDTNQTSRGTVLYEKNVTSSLSSTSSRKFTVSTTNMKKYDYLKIAVAVYDADGNQRWCNFGVKLTNSDLIVKAPDLYCDGEAVDHMEIVDYDLAGGTLTIKWTPQSAAASYNYKCVGLNEKPDFYDDYQGNRGTVLADGTVTSNTTSKCKFTLTTSEMKGYDYLKVAIAAYDSNGKAYWRDIGVRLVQTSGSTLSLSKSSLSMAYDGGSGSVTVSGASSYTVSYPTQDETAPGKKWLTVSKSGDTIDISARENYSASARSETITVRSSDGQTASIVVTQKAGYAAPTATIKIDKTYSSGDTYGPLANGGNDTLYLTVAVKNAQRIYVGTNNTTLGHKEVELDYSSTVTDHDCWFEIPAGLTPGIYPFTIYVSNSNVKDDQWAQAITPLTLNVQVVGTDTSSHKYALLGGYIYYIPNQDYFTDDWTKQCTGNNRVSDGSCKSVDVEGAKQCAGFAKYVEKQIYGGIGDYLDNKKTQLLLKSDVTIDKLKELIFRAGVGANVRAGIDQSQYDRGHSMIITAIYDTGFDVIHANWNWDCQVTTKDFTWESFLTWLQKKHTYWINGVEETGTYGIRYIRTHNADQTSVPSTPTVETTFSGTLNDMTVRLGEKAQLTGTVNLQGNTSIDRVTVNVRGYYDAADSRVLTRTFSDNLTTVKLENYAEFVVDTTVAPFNAAGSYTIRLWASGKDGTTLTQPIAEATVLVAEPVSALPSYTVDDLVKPLKHTLSYNETKNDYGCVHNDGKSVSIGLIQWNAHAGRALPVLKKIVAKNPEDAHAILGEALYQEIANNPDNYWTGASRTLNSDERDRVSKLLKTSYGIEVQDAQIEYDLTNKNLARVRRAGVTDPWAIVYFADIINVGDLLNGLLNAAVAEVGSVDKITLDVAHKVTQAHATYGQDLYATRLKYTYEYLKGVTFDGKHYNDNFTADPYPAKGSTLLSVAKSQIGYKGSSSDSNLTGANVASTGNYTKYGEYVGKNGSRWDAAFLSWCADQAGVTAIKKTVDVSPKDLCSNYSTKGAIAYFNEISVTQSLSLSYMKSNGIKSDRSSFTPAAGDLIFFGWDDSLFAGTPFTHVGIVSKISGGTVYYIDGDGDGEAVAERSCALTDTNISAYCKVSGSYGDPATSHRYEVLGGYIDYIPGQDYFTDSKTKECTGSNSVSGGTCASIRSGNAYQCAGFAHYVETEIYGKVGDCLDGKESGLLAYADVTVDSLKKLIQRAGLGANIRAGTSSGAGHSMIVTEITDSGFEVIHCNWDSFCGIDTKAWTWESFKTWLDKKSYGIDKIRVHNPVVTDNDTATAPTFDGYTALTVTDYDLSNGSLTITWNADNADVYHVNAILLNEVPTVGDDSQADRAVKTIKKGEHGTNSMTLTVDDLSGAQYLKFAIGASSENESAIHWSWIGFKLNGLFKSSEADMLLPAALTTIEDEAFYGMPVSSVYCPDGLKTIGAKAFANCNALKKIRIPSSVTKIDGSAFDGCKGLLIFGTKGSTAETFAKNHGFVFIAE